MKHVEEKKPRTTAQKWSRRAKIDEIIKELLAEKEAISADLE